MINLKQLSVNHLLNVKYFLLFFLKIILSSIKNKYFCIPILIDICNNKLIDTKV